MTVKITHIIERLNVMTALSNESNIVLSLLPQANTSFEIATIAQFFDFISIEERQAILNR